MQTSIYVEELGEEVSFEEFYTKIYKPGLLQIIKRYTFGLPGLILRAIKSEKTPLGNDNLNFDRRTGSDEILLKLLINQFNLSVDEKDGFVSLSATMPESIMAAQLVSSAQKLLQKFVIRYKLKKAEEDLRFIEERYGEKKNEFEIAQRNLAKYRDANKNVNTATALTEIERLESEYQLAFSVYSELAKQVEKQKIQVKENTPVFVVLQDAVIIEENSGISKKLLLILWVGFGLLFSSVWVGLSNFRSRLNEVVS
jgi:archaellum component FlaC